MSGYLRDRLAALVSLALLVALAGGTYYLAEWASDGGDSPDTQSRHEADFFVDGLTAVKLDASGQPTFRIAAIRMRHFPDDGSLEYDEPRMLSLAADRPPMTVQARHARSDANGVETFLSGEVIVVREAAASEPELRIRSDALVLDSDTQIAKTDRPVVVTRGGSRLTGVGMEFNNAARRLTVESEVRGTWAATSAAASD